MANAGSAGSCARPTSARARRRTCEEPAWLRNGPCCEIALHRQHVLFCETTCLLTTRTGRVKSPRLELLSLPAYTVRSRGTHLTRHLPGAAGCTGGIGTRISCTHLLLIVAPSSRCRKYPSLEPCGAYNPEFDHFVGPGRSWAVGIRSLVGLHAPLFRSCRSLRPQ